MDWAPFDRPLSQSELNYRHKAQVPSDFEFMERSYARWTSVIAK